MKKGQNARLIVKTALKAGISKQDLAYDCTVWSYNPDTERMRLLLTCDEMENVLLDYLYECEIYEEDTKQYCEGIIKERYHCEYGNMIEYQVRNGFYKNTIKLVDKQ